MFSKLFPLFSLFVVSACAGPKVAQEPVDASHSQATAVTGPPAMVVYGPPATAVIKHKQTTVVEPLKQTTVIIKHKQATRVIKRSESQATGVITHSQSQATGVVTSGQENEGEALPKTEEFQPVRLLPDPPEENEGDSE